MQQAAKTGKQSMAELDIDNVDKIMGEINEQSDAMASINDALAQPLGGAAVIDEDDLEAELEVLFPSHLLPDIGFRKIETPMAFLAQVQLVRGAIAIVQYDSTQCPLYRRR